MDRHTIAAPAHDLHLRRGMPPARVFLLSPARCDGERAKLLLSPNAAFPLATRLRGGAGVELGEVFSFLSGLYFRGKLTYARAFAEDSPPSPAILVITANRGLLAPETLVRAADLDAFAQVDIAGRSPLYLAPLQRDIDTLAESIGSDARIVLLGSIATGKYVDTLISTFGERVVFPLAFVGRGDMSRGGLLLRHAQEGRELEYAPVLGAERTGKRPPRLEPVR